MCVLDSCQNTLGVLVLEPRFSLSNRLGETSLLPRKNLQLSPKDLTYLLTYSMEQGPS